MRIHLSVFRGVDSYKKRVDSLVFPSIEVGSSFNDVFAVTVKSKSTTSINFLICRADAQSAWTQTITLRFMVLQTL